MLIQDLNIGALKNATMELQQVHQIKAIEPILPKWGKWHFSPSYNKLTIEITTTPFLELEYCMQLHIMENSHYYTHIFNYGSSSQKCIQEYEEILNGYLLPFITATQKFNTFLNSQKALLQLGEKYDFTNKGYIKGEIKMKKLETIIKEEIISTLENRDFTDGVYICDLISELYNMDYYIIGCYESKEFLKQNFDDMLEALEDYQNNVGEQYPYITDVEKVASLTALYVAEKVFNSLNTVRENWDYKLWHDSIILDSIIAELRGEN